MTLTQKLDRMISRLEEQNLKDAKQQKVAPRFKLVNRLQQPHDSMGEFALKFYKSRNLL